MTKDKEKEPEVVVENLEELKAAKQADMVVE